MNGGGGGGDACRTMPGAGLGEGVKEGERGARCGAHLDELLPLEVRLRLAREQRVAQPRLGEEAQRDEVRRRKGQQQRRQAERGSGGHRGHPARHQRRAHGEGEQRG